MLGLSAPEISLVVIICFFVMVAGRVGSMGDFLARRFGRRDGRRSPSQPAIRVREVDVPRKNG